MLISNKNNIRSSRRETTIPGAQKSEKGLFSFFSSELQNKQKSAEAQHRQSIDQLKSELEIAGENIEKDPSLNNFRHFRDLLSKIAKQVSGEAYRLDKIGGTAANPRYYEIITVINREADKLYALIVQEQKDRMAITEAVIGIKGLVIDLIT